GILKYLETVPEPETKWRGECYVFDDRVSVRHDLTPGDHVLCHACGRPVSPEGRLHADYVEGISCTACVDEMTDDQRARFAERQRQIELARARGEKHMAPRAEDA
ncbi:MAG: hypothetical protein RIM80_20720, partial [Alphaproteobacteria bacterium]